MMKKAQEEEYEEERKDLEQEKQELLSIRRDIQEKVSFWEMDCLTCRRVN